MGVTNEDKAKLAAKFMMQGLEENAAQRAAEHVFAFRAVKLLAPMADEAAAMLAMGIIR